MFREKKNERDWMISYETVTPTETNGKDLYSHKNYIKIIFLKQAVSKKVANTRIVAVMAASYKRNPPFQKSFLIL